MNCKLTRKIRFQVIFNSVIARLQRSFLLERKIHANSNGRATSCHYRINIEAQARGGIGDCIEIPWERAAVIARYRQPRRRELHTIRDAKFPVARSRNVPPFSIRRDFCRDYRAERCTKMLDAIVGNSQRDPRRLASCCASIPDPVKSTATSVRVSPFPKISIYGRLNVKALTRRAFVWQITVCSNLAFYEEEVYVRFVGKITDRLASSLKI